MKTESVKNRTVYNDVNNDHTYVTPRILKNSEKVENLYIHQVEKFQNFSLLQQTRSILLLGTKVSAFSWNQINNHPHCPKGFTWQFIEIKAIQHD